MRHVSHLCICLRKMRKIQINSISVSDRNDLKPNFREHLRCIRQNRIIKMVVKEIRITLTWEYPYTTQRTIDSVPDVVSQSLDRYYGHVLFVKTKIRPNYGVLCAHLCG